MPDTHRAPRCTFFVLTALAIAAGWLPGLGQQAGSPSDLEEATIASLIGDQQSGRRTARAIAERYLARIDAIDRNGPALHSVIELNPDALAIADALDAERKAKGLRGPLHGIPVLIKDNIDTADRMSTTAGSLALEGSIASRDAFIVSRLRAAGAVILGKTNLSEWANFRSTRSTSGWSGRGGQVLNPYALDRNACGSSSGTGVGDRGEPGSDRRRHRDRRIDRLSVRGHGLVGIKPTVGLVSRSGIIPIAHSQDTAGPMARTVADAAVLLDAIAASDPRDPATTTPRRRAVADHAALDRNALRGARIGVARASFFGYSDVDRHARGGRDRRHEGAGRGHRRPGEHPARRQVRCERARRAALRIQGRSEQVPGADSGRRRACVRWPT